MFYTHTCWFDETVIVTDHYTWYTQPIPNNASFRVHGVTLYQLSATHSHKHKPLRVASIALPKTNHNHHHISSTTHLSCKLCTTRE